MNKPSATEGNWDPTKGTPYRIKGSEKRDPFKVYHNEQDFQRWQDGKAEFVANQVKAVSQKVRKSRKHLSQSQVSRLKNELRNADLTLMVG